MGPFEEAGADGARFLTAGPGYNTKFPSVEVRLLRVPISIIKVYDPRTSTEAKKDIWHEASLALCVEVWTSTKLTKSGAPQSLQKTFSF